MAGQSVEITGDTVKIKLVSDDAGNAWGFKVTSVIGTGNVENDECLVTFDPQGGSPVPSFQMFVLASKAICNDSAPSFV